MRVVTTLPSATELVAALGLEPVGVSHECDYPPGVESKPAITRSRISEARRASSSRTESDDDAGASSGEIDRQVLEATESEGGVYDVDVETLEALEPDLIVTQGMCDVCAVDEAVVADALERIDADPDVLTVDPHTVEDVLDDLERVGRAIGREDRAREVRSDLEGRIGEVRRTSSSRTQSDDAAVRERTADIGDRDHPRVAIFDWTDPVMIAGHWTAELVDWAGGAYGLADVGERSRPREWDAIREYDPEIAIVAPCGFDLEQTTANRADLTDREGWDDLAAVRNDRVWAMDGHHYLNRPGPRLVDTLEALAPIVQPDLFDGPPESVAVPFDDLERLESTAGSRADPTP